MTADVEEVLEVPPRDYAVRGYSVTESDGEQIRAASLKDDEQPVMFGHLALFNESARVDSRIEGQFIEKIAPGAFKNTINQNRSRMRVIYDHGNDPRFGRHPLGPIQELREDERGVYYEVPLLDNSTNRDLLPGLRAGVYGASFKFRAVKMDRPVRPRSATAENPDRWEERTVRELEMVEFGPTPFPVYAGPTAGIRSLTDEFRIGQLGIDPEQLRQILASIALPPEEPATATPPVSRAQVPASRFRSSEDFLAWLAERA